MKKNRKIFFISVILIATLCIVFFFYLKNKNNPIGGDKNSLHQDCLMENEVATYPLNPKYATNLKIPQSPLRVNISSKISNNIIFEFMIPDVLTDVVRAVQLRSCGVYVIRGINFDATKANQSPGANVRLWHFFYSGKGLPLLTFSEKKQDGGFTSSFSQTFVVDPGEKYIVLERGYFGEKDYALVIKDLKTLQDVYTLSLADVKKINPNVSLGGFDLGKWTDDGKYFWGTLFDGALDVAYYRIEAGTWKADIFSPPAGIPSGAERATGFAGYLAYADFPSFFGISAFGKDAYDKFRAEGNVKHFYLYNLFTKEKILLGTVSDPEWHFKPDWVSDTELHYSLPSGDQVYHITP